MERVGWAGGPAVGVILTWLASGVIISAAATVATFPLVALNFGRLPLLGIPTTILATPLLPFALVGGMATGLAGMVHPLLGQIVGLVSTAPLTGLLKLVEAVPGWTLAIGLDNAGPVLGLVRGAAGRAGSGGHSVIPSTSTGRGEPNVGADWLRRGGGEARVGSRGVILARRQWH